MSEHDQTTGMETARSESGVRPAGSDLSNVVLSTRGESVGATDIPATQPDSSASLFDRLTARVVRHLSQDSFPLTLFPDGWVEQQQNTPVELFAAQAFVLATASALGVGVAVLIMGIVAGIGLLPAASIAATLSVISGLVTSGVRFGMLVLNSQGKEDEINAVLPGAVAYMYSQAAADASIYSVIGSIANAEDAYGPVAKEFQSVVRRCEYFGYELQQALAEQSEVTGSDDLGRLMSDIVTFLDSGGDITGFFSREMDRAFGELENRDQERIDYLDLLSTLYVPVATLPILAIIIMVALSSFRPVPRVAVLMFAYVLTPILPAVFLVLTDVAQPSEAASTALVTANTDRPILSGPIHHGSENRESPVTPAESETASRQRTRVGSFGGSHRDHEQSEVPTEALHPVDEGLIETPTAETLAESSPAFESVPTVERRNRIRSLISDPLGYFRLYPFRTLIGSVPLTLVVMAILGNFVLTPPTIGGMVSDPIATTVGWVILPLALSLTPVMIAHEYDIRQREALFAQYPEMLQRVSAANETGMTFMESLREAIGEKETQIDREMELINQKVSMGVPVETALTEFANAYSDPEITQSTRLIIEAQRASERVSDVLGIAIDAGLTRLSLREKQKSETKSYVMIIALTTLVIIVAAAGLSRVLTSILGSGLLGGVGSTGSLSGAQSSVSSNFTSDMIRTILYHVSMIYAGFGGLFAGYMGETEFASGLKYSLTGMLIGTGIWWIALGGGGIL
ncbi:type II secretion system F family protein [Halorubrum pallidum]|uniref:Type II secretion system F family protein n=1 Tax=Halorubrum pallidum TaxID=1526114 RepID=A0ABD5T025_9EURY